MAPRLLVTGGSGFVRSPALTQAPDSSPPATHPAPGPTPQPQPDFLVLLRLQVLSNVVHAWLASDSAATAVIMDLPRAWDPAAQAFLAAFTAAGRLAFFDGSVTDEAAWAGLSEKHGSAFTHVVSGAAVTPTRADEEAGAARILDVNLFGCIRALEFARSLPGLHRFVFVSSDAVYAPPGLVRPPLEGEEPQSSMGLYSLSKFAGEKAVGRWAELFGLDATCVRFADVYGQLDRDTGARNRHNAPYWVCRQAVAGRPVRVQGALDDLGWDYIAAPDVGDALCALLRAAQRPALPVYVIGIGRPVPHAELLEAVFAAAPPGEGRPLLECLFSAASKRRVLSTAGLGESPTLAELVESGAVVQVAEDAPSLAANDGGDVHLAALPVPHPLRLEPYDISPLEAEFGWTPRPLKEAVADYVSFLRSQPAASL